MTALPSSTALRKATAALIALEQRERQRVLQEILQVRGLLPLLMKRRNGQPWSAIDRIELRTHLQRLSEISPYLLPLIMPGGLLLLPALAWWLDRRRKRRTPPDHMQPAI